MWQRRRKKVYKNRYGQFRIEILAAEATDYSVKRLIKKPALWLLRKSPLLQSWQMTDVPLRDVKSVLFIRFSPHLGSIMCTTPLLSAVRKYKPNIKIGVVCDEFNWSIYRHSPYVDELLIVPNPQRYFVRSCIALHKLRPDIKGYEWIVADSANGRNIYLIPMLLTGIGKIAGFGDSNSILSYRYPYPPQGTSEIYGNMYLLKMFGIEDIPETMEPELFFSTDDEKFVDRFLEENEIGPEQVVVAMQTQSKDNKPNRWRGERFAELADKMVRELGVTVVFTGAKSEAENVERIRGKMSQSSVLSAGKTTIPQLAALLQRCRLFVTLDTGSMHVGRAIGVPMVILASAYQAPEIWLPVNNPNCLILRKGDIPCVLCHNELSCTMECMDAINTTEVFDAVRRQLLAREISDIPDVGNVGNL